MSSRAESIHEFLNPFQANRVRVTGQYIDNLLADIEGILNLPASKAAFPRLDCDIAPSRRNTIDEYLARVRAQLVEILKSQGIQPPEHTIPASRAVPLSESAARGLLDACIVRFELEPLNHSGFREALLHFSGRLPGSIVNMCRMASEPCYRDRDRAKVRLIHIDYLLRANQIPSFGSRSS